jgi:hypothetical protein
MEPWRANQLALAGCLARLRPPRHPVVGALRLPDRQWRSGALDLLDAETNACQEAESRAREEACHQMGCAGEMGQYLDHFLPCTHHGHPLRLLGLFESVQRWARTVKAGPFPCFCSQRARDFWPAGLFRRNSTAASEKAHLR